MDVSVERTSDGRLAVKLQTDEWEVNVHASAAELAPPRGVRAIGHDDETWDVAVTVPHAVVEEIVRLAYGS